MAEMWSPYFLLDSDSGVSKFRTSILTLGLKILITTPTLGRVV